MLTIFDGYEQYLQGPSFSSARKNLGNKLFIYASHYLLAEMMDCSLVVPSDPLIQRNGVFEKFPYGSISRTDRESKPERWLSFSEVLVLGSIPAVAQEFMDYNVTSNAEFSNYKYIQPYKSKIRNLYRDLINPQKTSNDIILLLRSSNHDRSFILPDDYYISILEEESFENLYISYDHYENHLNLFAKLEKYNPILLDLPILELFKEVTSFKKLVCSQGTFSFWAGLLSQAEKIYWPVTNAGPNKLNDPGVNLLVDDEPRYTHVDVIIHP